MSTASYLDRFLEPVTTAFTPELARTFADLRADPELQSQVDDLAKKANDGTITPKRMPIIRLSLMLLILLQSFS
jgi:hypothetical protein